MSWCLLPHSNETESRTSDWLTLTLSVVQQIRTAARYCAEQTGVGLWDSSNKVMRTGNVQFTNKCNMALFTLLIFCGHGCLRILCTGSLVKSAHTNCMTWQYNINWTLVILTRAELNKVITRLSVSTARMHYTVLLLYSRDTAGILVSHRIPFNKSKRWLG